MVLWGSAFCPGPSSDLCSRVPALLPEAGLGSAEEPLGFDSCFNLTRLKCLLVHILLPSDFILLWFWHGLMCHAVVNQPTQTMNHRRSLAPLPSRDQWQFGCENNSSCLTDLVSWSAVHLCPAESQGKGSLEIALNDLLLWPEVTVTTACPSSLQKEARVEVYCRCGSAQGWPESCGTQACWRLR